MKYNKIERCKFSKSRRHLIELMRAYGLKNLLVREKDEEVAMLVMARSFVIKQLQKLSIALNVPETRQENWKAICDLRQTVSGRQKRLFQDLTFRQSDLPLAYDLNQESHIQHYLEWFELGKYSLSEGKINRIIKKYITDEEAKSRFRELAQQMNERIVVSQQSNDASMPAEEEDDIDETGE